MSRKNTAQVEAEVVEQSIEPEKAVAEPILTELYEQFKTKSAVIRHLSSLNWTRGRIAKFMNIRYQHVRNVLVTPLKKAAE